MMLTPASPISHYLTKFARIDPIQLAIQ